MLARCLVVLTLMLVALGCQEFDPPPEPSVASLDNGVMKAAPDAPFVLKLSEPFVKSSLRIKIIKAVMDSEENLLDEQSPPDFEAFDENTLIAYDGAAPDDEARSFGATFELNGTSLTINPAKAFAVSAPYLLLIEPGLRDLDGHKTLPRIRIPFTYELTGGGKNTLPTGYYYFILNVDYLSTQIQVFAYMEVDPETGIWRARFTNANRRAQLNSRPGCPSCSGDTPICALVTQPRCVKPSQKQSVLDEYVDFLPESEAPDGYFFIADGFAKDEANQTTAFGTAPFLIQVAVGSGGITVDAENTRISGIFRKHEDDRWRATGSLSVEVVKLNNVGSDPTKGTFEAMSLSAAEVEATEAFGIPIPTNLEK
jgi:hypothetical protein